MIEIIQGESLNFILEGVEVDSGDSLDNYTLSIILGTCSISGGQRDCHNKNGVSWYNIPFDSQSGSAIWCLNRADSERLEIGKYSIEVALNESNGGCLKSIVRDVLYVLPKIE